MARPHDDAELLGLARDGSAAALASLLHRHRPVLQRATLTAADPERAVRAAMTAAMRALRSGDLSEPDALPELLTAAARREAERAPRAPDVEPLLPTDWFDRAWVAAAAAWPSGRRPLPRPPRWLVTVAAAVALALAGGGTTWVVLSSGEDREVLGGVVATPLEGPSALDDTPPAPAPAVEEAPELFGDVEIGELPTYDLTRPDAPTPAGPEVVPPAG